MAEIKNIDELRAAYPDLLASAESAAQANGRDAERERIRGIEDIENAIGDKELVNGAKFGENPMTAEQLAFAAMKKQAGIGANMLNSLEADANASGASDVDATPAEPNEPQVDEDEQAINMIVGKNKEVK